jgi:mannose-6-phosphate isomerase-like protein (cupin superfamily)
MKDSDASRTGRSSAKPTEWLQTRPGERCLIHLDATATGGVYSFVEILSEPGDGTPLHRHTREDEHIMVLEGTARIAYGDRIFDAGAGSLVTLKKDIPHAWGNRSDAPLRIAVIAYPGGCEEALRALAKASQDDLLAVARRVGVEHLGPAPF